MPRKRTRSFAKVSKWPLSLLMFVVGFGAGYGSYEYLPKQGPIGVVGESDAIFDIRFSPRGGCLDLILRTLAEARDHVYVHTYSFTSKEITEALIAAHRRGVRVLVVADKGSSKDRRCRLGALVDAGIEVRIDKVSGLAHNKVMIVDGGWVITGSYNWSKNAETRNAENIVRITSGEVNRCYEENFFMRYNRAKPM